MAITFGLRPVFQAGPKPRGQVWRKPQDWNREEKYIVSKGDNGTQVARHESRLQSQEHICIHIHIHIMLNMLSKFDCAVQQVFVWLANRSLSRSVSTVLNLDACRGLGK